MIEGLMSDSQRTYVETYEDKPATVRFVDTRRRRIQIFEHCYWDGEWKRAVFCKAGFLEDPKPSPYLDEDGQPEPWLIAQCAYRDREGNPYGVVRRYKDLQDEINKRRSKALHALSQRRVVADRGAVEDVNKARTEVQRPDGWVEKAPGMEVTIQDNTDIGMSQFQLLVDAINALNATGPNLALQGQTGNTSGRAKQLDQEGGAIQIGALFDHIRHFQKRVARATWNRIRQFWKEETWVRVTDDEQKLKFVGLNVPVTQGEAQVQALMQQGLPPEQLQAAIMQIGADPMAQVPVSKKNNVGKMHVDIIIEEAPDTVTLQQEQFAELVALAPAGVIFPQEVYIEASGLRNKQRLIELMKGGGEMSPEQQAQAQQQQALQQAGAEADIRKRVADASKAEADTQKTIVETAVMMDSAARPEIQDSPT